MTRGSSGAGRRGEVRLPAVVAVLVAIGLQAALPNRLVLGPRLLVPALEVVLLLPLVAINPVRMTKETRLSRSVSLALVLLIAVANTGVLALLVDALADGKAKDGKQLLLAALQVWLTNVIAYGLVYWELDRGGPVSRTQKPRTELPDADFRFPQDEDHDASVEVARGSSQKNDWVPVLTDYLYVSVTNSSAFSPTDTMPLRSRTKMLMALQSTSALVLSLLVVAHAVGTLK
ncbi:MAG TPA: hypothetical protein VM097_07155 [Mycobacteriales bacterium]|nr:hypothetical protein [Mycobacteriales bacterium]